MRLEDVDIIYISSFYVQTRKHNRQSLNNWCSNICQLHTFKVFAPNIVCVQYLLAIIKY